ncbi:predicted protein [Uncinocarpus reesii 1704]|uniref:Uncharacterized protein n=1 Tax=Uncinocarpus reesii (strain UAMH 1704) TaxID=336963 RepID=C4JIB9_UNCRE|nr:uncharacterized protein UREG_02865 [Uncinocarpus reesii 1704]EEP78016.1 predicted protein [Uncinocarpus reesii 1704]
MDVTAEFQELPRDDDIEIDLDVYEDHVEIDDGDIVVDDASATASNHPDMSEDFDDLSKDADMVDDYSTTHISRTTPPQSDHSEYNAPVPQPDQAVYDEEVEDDYEEDIDAPIPGNYEEDGVATTSAQDLSAPNGDEEDVQSMGIQAQQSLAAKSEPVSTDEQATLNHPQGCLTQASEKNEFSQTDYAAQISDEKVYDQKSEYTQADFHSPYKNGEEEGVPEAEPKEPTLTSGQGVTEQLQDTQEDTERIKEEVKVERIAEQGNESIVEPDGIPDEVDNMKKKHPEPVSVGHQGPEVQGENIEDYSPLHRVTVLYQDNEMSLFPPNESDPSEIYLLEDEELAHAPLYELFKAFRKVLGTYIADEDELVVSIDSLYIQLSEIAVKSLEVTLSQILRLYLDFCRNDDIEDPGPLYLNLSSRPTLKADLAALQTAADNGQGLSQLGAWQDADEAVDADGETELPATVESDSDDHGSSPSEAEVNFSVSAEHIEDSVAGQSYPNEEERGSTLDTRLPKSEEILQEKQLDMVNEKFSDSEKNRATNIPEGDGDEEQEDSWHDEENRHSIEVDSEHQNDIADTLGQGEVQTLEPDQTGVEEVEDGEIQYQTDGTMRARSPLYDDTDRLSTTAASPSAETPLNEEARGNAQPELAQNVQIGADATEELPEHESNINLQVGPNDIPGNLEDQRDSTPIPGNGEIPNVSKSPDRPVTPNPNPDDFDIDADLFKSPVVEPYEHANLGQTNVQPFTKVESPARNPTYEETSELMAFDNDRDEFPEWDLIEPEKDHIPPYSYSPKVEKRPRVDEEYNDSEDASPDLKRHRSE